MLANDTNSYSIAVGLDGSDRSWRALEEAFWLAKHKQAVLHIVSIQESIEASYNASEILAAEKTEQTKLEQIQIKARMLAERSDLTVVTAIVEGSSAGALLSYVRGNKIALLVIGQTGHSSLLGALLGTTAEKIVRSAPCSVLVVH